MKLSVKDLKPSVAVKQLVSDIEKIKTSEEFTGYLDFISKFHTYSFYNQGLIRWQCPGATLVKGFVGWKNLGRYVEKGPIKILAPRFYKKEIKKSGSKEVELIDGKYFVYVNVWDISQTKGDPIPKYSIDIIEDHEQATEVFTLLTQYCNSNGIVVDQVTMGESHYGTSFMGRIELNDSKSYTTKVATLIHEIAHEELHKLKERLECSKTKKEYEAEATAYVVCKAIGFPILSDKYLALHKEYDIVQSLTSISKTAKQIISFIVEGLIPSTPLTVIK